MPSRPLNTKCGCYLMRRFNPTSVPRRYGTKHQSDEAKEAGAGRGLTRHFSGSCGLLLRLIQRLSVLLLDLVQATASSSGLMLATCARPFTACSRAALAAY